MPIDGDQLGGEAADVTKLLALPGLRRSLEPQPAFELDAAMVAKVMITPANVTDLRTTMQTLVELIAAIDEAAAASRASAKAPLRNAALAPAHRSAHPIGEIGKWKSRAGNPMDPGAVV
jgi:hypothetical protein